MMLAPIRIDLWRGARALLFTLVLPVSLALVADLLAGSLPWLTIAAVLVCIPLATIVVNRTVLAEFERVVASVAQPASEEQEGAGESPAADGTGDWAGDCTGAAGEAADFTPTDWPLDGQQFTEGAQRHHG
jgi:hypothetical protein